MLKRNTLKYLWEKNLRWVMGVSSLLLMLFVFTNNTFATQVNENGQGKNVHSELLVLQDAESEKKLININVIDMQLEEALKLVAEKLRVGISFKTEIIPDKKVNLRLDNQPVFIVLHKLLENTNLESILPPSKDVIIIRSKEDAEILDIQEGSIEGRIIDEVSGEALIGATVLIQGTSIGASTDQEGNFEISGIPVGEYVLVVRFIGYQSEQINVQVIENEVEEITVGLRREALGLEELVVTGTAGDVRRRSIGNSVSRIDVESLTDDAYMSSVENTLQSNVPGLTLMPGSGTAGTSSSIRLRGTNTLNVGNEPVFYVDGVRINQSQLGSFGVFGQTTSALEMIDPQDIQSIEVIKGPSAATLYGADAASGVIQIITKRGSMGERNINFNASVSQGVSYWPERWRPTNYAVATEARINNPELWPGFVGKQVGDIITNVPLTESNALRHGLISNYNLSARGGGENYSFFISGSHNDEEGVFLNNQSRRNAVRGNFSVLVTDNIDARVNVSFARNNINLPLNDNTADGAIISAWLATPGRDTGSGQGYLILGPDEFNQYDNRTRADRFLLGGTISYKPFEWFENRVQIGYDLTNTRAEVFFPPNNPFADRTSFGLANEDGLIAKGRPQKEDMTIEYHGTIAQNFGENTVSNTSFGFQYLTAEFSNTQAFGQDIGSEVIRSIGSAAVTQSTEEFFEEKSLGFYLQEQISLNDRLFFTGALRLDNHSAFGDEISTELYPKVSTSYVISEAPFFEIENVDHFRVRAAWGQAGSAPGPFDAPRTFSTTATTLEDGSSVSALQTSSFGNPDLKPERTSEFEVGFDASLFGERMNLEFSFYNSRTKDALINVDVAPSSGFSGSQLQNLGEISNKGIELNLQVIPVQHSNFILQHSFNLSYNKNEMVSFGLREDPVIFGIYSPVHRFETGKPIASFWADEVQFDEQGNLITDARGVPILNTSFRGPSLPPWEGSFSTTATLFNNWRLFVLLDAAAGHYQFNVKDWRRDRSGLSWETANPDADPDIVTARRFPSQTGFHIQPADFVKLRDVSLSYSLPARWTNQLGVNSARLSVKGRNLAIITRYGGADPEVNFSGNDEFNRNDSWTQPMSRQILGSLNIGF